MATSFVSKYICTFEKYEPFTRHSFLDSLYDLLYNWRFRRGWLCPSLSKLYTHLHVLEVFGLYIWRSERWGRKSLKFNLQHNTVVRDLQPRATFSTYVMHEPVALVLCIWIFALDGCDESESFGNVKPFARSCESNSTINATNILGALAEAAPATLQNPWTERRYIPVIYMQRIVNFVKIGISASNERRLLQTF